MARTTVRVYRMDDGGRAMLRLEEEVPGAHSCEWLVEVGELDIDDESLLLLMAARAADPAAAGRPLATPGTARLD